MRKISTLNTIHDKHGHKDKHAKHDDHDKHGHGRELLNGHLFELKAEHTIGLFKSRWWLC